MQFSEIPFSRMLELNTYKHPHKPAIIYESWVWSYEKVNKQVNRLANALFALGYRKGDNIAVLMENRPELLISYYALGKLGIVSVSFNYRLSDNDFRHVLINSDVRAIIIEKDYFEKIDNLGIPFRHTIIVEDNGKTFSNTSLFGENLIGYNSLLNNAYDRRPEFVAYSPVAINHTSGTTGVPKGVVRSRYGFFERVVEQGWGPDDKMLIVVPACLSMGFAYTLLAHYLGGTIVFVKKFDPEQVLQKVESEKINAAIFVPTMLKQITDVPKIRRYDLSSMRVMLSGAGEVTDKVRLAAIDLFGPVLNIYAGSTEAGLYSNLRPGEIMAKIGGGNCVGRPFYGVEKIVLLGKDGREVQVGEVGEICVRSPSPFDGYYRDPEGSAELRRGDCLSVGDLGRFDEEGYLYFVGRERDIIKSGGINVYAPEIEEVIMEHPEIKEAAIIGIPDPKWTEAIMAVVVRVPGTGISEEEVIRHCERRLASYKKPRHVRFIDELPKNLTGKVLKEELRNKFETGG